MNRYLYDNISQKIMLCYKLEKELILYVDQHPGYTLEKLADLLHSSANRAIQMLSAVDLCRK